MKQVELAYVLCIENNAIRDQALLLIDSIRAFAGRYSSAEILVIAPRPALGVDNATRTQLEKLGATYHEAPLNTNCPEYGSANRVYAAAWAAENVAASTLIVLDSDTIFLDEPDLLGEQFDVAARPVDVKGSTTAGPGDEFEAYWQALCALAESPIDRLPFIETTFDRTIVRASYNGGYSVVRRETGILQRAADIFTRSVLADIRPYKGRNGFRIFASTGFVPDLAAEYWGSNQAAFSIAAWSTTRRFRALDIRYNVPLHILDEPQHWSDEWASIVPIHVHYHWMLDPEHRARTMKLLSRLGVPADRLDWISARRPP
ncbi:MAG: hypothetical protein HYX37_19060 [Rhizobiales bacterium]|nr:hypothetical protein [Hyphomicrobiales bacterium]